MSMRPLEEEIFKRQIVLKKLVKAHMLLSSVSYGKAQPEWKASGCIGPVLLGSELPCWKDCVCQPRGNSG